MVTGQVKFDPEKKDEDPYLVEKKQFVEDGRQAGGMIELGHAHGHRTGQVRPGEEGRGPVPGGEETVCRGRPPGRRHDRARSRAWSPDRSSSTRRRRTRTR